MTPKTAASSSAGHHCAQDMRVGYAWAALGRHTTQVQRQWAAEDAGAELVLLPSNTPTAGLREGLVDVAVLRHSLEDERFATAAAT